MSPNEYLFVLGRTYDLCRAELVAVLKREKIDYQVIFLRKEIFHFSTSSFIDSSRLINLLGGTVKIIKIADFRSVFDSIEKGEKINFGLSFYGKGLTVRDLHNYCREFKEKLIEKEVKARFVLPHTGTVLSSVVVAKQKIKEINIIEEDGQSVFGYTLNVQDFESWSKRDYERPCIAPRIGMIPPKVARMMVNIGVTDSKATVFDPFCGVGTILAEAMMIGCRAIGGDQLKEQIEKTRKNLEWLVKSYHLYSSYRLFTINAVHVSEIIKPCSADTIVTEPYLGPNIPLEYQKLQRVIKGLRKLYLGCLKDWRKILKTGGKIVIVLPSYPEKKGENDFVKYLIDICEKVEYNIIAGPYSYFRPEARVKRNIFVLELISR